MQEIASTNMQMSCATCMIGDMKVDRAQADKRLFGRECTRNLGVEGNTIHQTSLYR